MKFNLVHDLLSGLAWHEHLFGIFFGVLVFFFCVGICMRLHQCFGFLGSCVVSGISLSCLCAYLPMPILLLRSAYGAFCMHNASVSLRSVVT